MMLLFLLFKAKHNILTSQYSVNNTEAIKLGGILACVEHGRFDESEHKHGYFK